MPYVVVQDEGALEPLVHWPCAEGSNAEEIEARRWEGACTRLVQRALKKGRTSSWNVFVLFDKEEFPENRDRPALAEIMHQARTRSWGSRLFVVLSEMPTERLLDSARADLRRWMDELLSGKVFDLIQIADPIDRHNPNGLWPTLRNRSTSCIERQGEPGAAGNRFWRCAVPPDCFSLADFLEPSLTVTDPTQYSEFDLVIPLQKADHQEGEIERVLTGLEADAVKRCRVVTFKQDPTTHLRQYCERRGLRQPIAVGGYFELWYLLLRLNQRAQSAQVESHYSMRPVPLSKTPHLHLWEPQPLPSVLLTSAFDHGEEDDDYHLDAATDIGELLHRAPLEMTYRVVLDINPERLRAALDGSDIDVWIHMGHGNGKEGLWIPGLGDVEPEKWVGCFHGRDLRLAVFLTCDSHEIARCFAEHGAGVAIGFDGKVESEVARHLAIEVLKAVLAEGMRGGTILAGFRNGEARFEAIQTLNAHPRAYYPWRA